MSQPAATSGPGIVTARLRLVLWDAGTVAALRAEERRRDWHRDFPRPDDLGAAALWREGDPWGPRSIVRAGVVVGSIGFFTPPEIAADGVAEAEVGYGLVAEARGLGLATEALRALLGPVDRAGVRLRASIAPDNTAGLRVAAKAGFTGVRGSSEDGELVLVRPPRR